MSWSRNRIRDSGPDDAAGSRARPDRQEGQKDTGQDIMLYTGRCTDQDADSRQQTDGQDHSLIHLAQPRQQQQVHATASTRAQQPDQTKPQTSEQNTTTVSYQTVTTRTGTWKP